MSLKQLVNTPDIWDAFLEELDTKIEIHRKTLESTDRDIVLYREQGAIKALNRLKQLREEVNFRDKMAG